MQVDNNNHQATLGIVLSGGAGRRLGGLDKGLQIYRGRPLIEWVLEILTPQVDEIILCVNRNYEKYSLFGHTVITDDDPNFEGPMAGLVSAINEIEKSARSDHFSYLQLASCDAPLIPKNLVEILKSSLQEKEADVAVPHDGDRRQNLHCLIKAQSAESIRKYYQEGGRALHRWFAENNCHEVDFSNDFQKFKNLNMLEQLQSR